jgi:serine/threonine protein kinase
VQGSGGCGVVYQAHDRVLGRLVAIKMPQPGWPMDPCLRERFRVEASAAASVWHANVVVVYDFVQRARLPYLVMEWLEGGSLAEVLHRHGPLSPQSATKTALAACCGLQAVHGRGWIHRDIKPGNLLLSHDGQVKLGDFGLALPMTSGGAIDPAGTSGTPAFFSPEQAWGLPLDPRSDLYSLGATYFALLMGKTPYQAAQVLEYARLHRDGPVPDPRLIDPSVPAACAAIVRRVMAKKPADRYADAAQMHADLGRCLADLGQE